MNRPDQPHLTAPAPDAAEFSMFEAAREEGQALHDNLAAWHRLAVTHGLDTRTVLFDKSRRGFRREMRLLRGDHLWISRWRNVTSIIAIDYILHGPSHESLNAALGVTNTGDVLVFPEEASFYNRGALWYAKNVPNKGSECSSLALALHQSYPFNGPDNLIEQYQAQNLIDYAISHIQRQLRPAGLTASAPGVPGVQINRPIH